MNKLLHSDSGRSRPERRRAIYSLIPTGKIVRMAHSTSVSSSMVSVMVRCWSSTLHPPPLLPHPPPQEAQSLGSPPPFVNGSLILCSSFFLIFSFCPCVRAGIFNNNIVSKSSSECNCLGKNVYPGTKTCYNKKYL